MSCVAVLCHYVMALCHCIVPFCCGVVSLCCGIMSLRRGIVSLCCVIVTLCCNTLTSHCCITSLHCSNNLHLGHIGHLGLLDLQQYWFEIFYCKLNLSRDWGTNLILRLQIILRLKQGTMNKIFDLQLPRRRLRC